MNKHLPDLRQQAHLLGPIGTTAVACRVQAYAVGGCVRDWLMGSPMQPDIDIAVAGDAIGLAKQVQKVLGGRVTAHAAFGTASLQLDSGDRVDFARCRKEVYGKPAAYPKVTGGTLEEDLFRRDFSINAMAVSLMPGSCQTLIDPFKGCADLKQGYLRVLHARSFVDDPSRILRGIRFSVRLGFKWEPETLVLVKQAIQQGHLGALNFGRVYKEFERFDTEPNPPACFQTLEALLNSN